MNDGDELGFADTEGEFDGVDVGFADTVGEPDVGDDDRVTVGAVVPSRIWQYVFS